MRGLLYIIVLFIITGCTYSNMQPKALDEAQSLMQTDPEAAMKKLNGLDVSEFEDSATMARWALLYSEALLVNRLSAPTDTIVNIAIDYYGAHNQTAEFQKASRLKALIQATDNMDDLASALYLQKEKEFMLYKERSEREKTMLIAFTIALIAAGMLVWFRQKLKLRSAQNDALMSEVSGLRCRIEASNGDIDRLETKLRDVLRNRFTLLDSLSQTYYETQGTKNERKAIADKVRSEIESVRTDAFPEMEQTVNDCRDNLLVRVREYYPEIKPEEYQLLVYLTSGLSARTISLLLGESVDVIYKRKSRLKSRLKETVAPACPDIMEIF